MLDRAKCYAEWKQLHKQEKQMSHELEVLVDILRSDTLNLRELQGLQEYCPGVVTRFVEVSGITKRGLHLLAKHTLLRSDWIEDVILAGGIDDQTKQQILDTTLFVLRKELFNE